MGAKQILMIPGPTPVPEKVLLAMAKHPIGHRSGDFSQIIAQVNQGLKWLHQTKNEVLTLASSGTGAMEAGIINFLSPGDQVLVGDNGKFGERWGKVCQAFGLNTEIIKAEWGQPLDPQVFRDKLMADQDKKIKAVIITHSETSTGVLNDLKAINTAVKDHGEALIIVDAVTSLGATNVPVDEWGLDVVASGSQKGYMIPPGLGFVAVSDKAWKAYETAKLPRFYFDLGKYKKANANNTTPFTPAINLYFALHAALELMQEEGLENIFDRHQKLTKITREGVKALGWKLYAPDQYASHAITAVDPSPLNAEELRKYISKTYDIALAGGQDHLKGQIFRIGHLGFACEREMLTVLAVLKESLAVLKA